MPVAASVGRKCDALAVRAEAGLGIVGGVIGELRKRGGIGGALEINLRSLPFARACEGEPLAGRVDGDIGIVARFSKRVLLERGSQRDGGRTFARLIEFAENVDDRS